MLIQIFIGIIHSIWKASAISPSGGIFFFFAPYEYHDNVFIVSILHFAVKHSLILDATTTWKLWRDPFNIDQYTYKTEKAISAIMMPFEAIKEASSPASSVYQDQLSFHLFVIVTITKNISLPTNSFSSRQPS